MFFSLLQLTLWLTSGHLSGSFRLHPHVAGRAVVRTVQLPLQNHYSLRRRCGAAVDMDWDPKAAPKLDFNEDFYTVLEVEPTIPQKDLKRAYYKLVFRFHPDNCKDSTDEAAKTLCNKQMMVINAAYKVLKEPADRAVYDRKRLFKSSPPSSSSSSASPKSSTYSSNRPGSSVGFDTDGGFFSQQPTADETVESLSDMLGEIWGEIRRGGGAGLIEDLVDFLEERTPGFDNSWQPKEARENDSRQSREELDKETSMLQTALDNLTAHLGDLTRLRTQEEKAAREEQLQGQSERTVQTMEARLKRLEALRGLAARIEEVERQIRQLKRQVKVACEKREPKSGQSTAPPSQQRSAPRSEEIRAKVDQELLELKRRMKL